VTVAGEPAAPIDPAQRRLAERRLLAALRRHQRRSPLRPDLRADSLVAEMRGAQPTRGAGHRGRQPLTLSDGELRNVLDEMVVAGTLLRSGHRVRLAEPGPALDPVMRERVDRLMATLRAAGAMPPATEGVATRLGIPAAMVDQLRAAGELVAAGPRIDYPREAWTEISDRLDRLASDGPLSVRLVRDELGATRRHAEAVLRHWNRSRMHSS
jgi:hypothetical protein